MSKLFQMINFWILKPLFGGKGISGNWFIWQIRIARIFGGADLVLIGDSNSAVFSKRKVIGKTSKIVLCMGVPGTTSTDWIEWFKTKKGLKIKKFLQKNKQVETIWNIGGNHAILNKMETVEEDLLKLHKMFLRSYNCTVPPVKYQWLETQFNKSAEKWQEEFDFINQNIRLLWGYRAIDLYSYFIIQPPIVRENLQKDAVHFSGWAVDFIFKFLKYI